ncbi:hypothetical protein X975_26095, partial [Stegodyphus mimosarum]
MLWRIFSRSSSIRLCFSFLRSSASRKASSLSCSSSAAASLSSDVSASPAIWPLTAFSLLPIICLATKAAMLSLDHLNFPASSTMLSRVLQSPALSSA